MMPRIAPSVASKSARFFDYRRNDARIAENGFATNGGMSKSAKVVLGPVLNYPIPKPVIA
jgi:hypothetical protein